jgi:hypothetical protein
VQKGKSRAGLSARFGECPICHTKNVGEPHGFAWLSGGALRRVSRNVAMPASDLLGFLALGYHGAHDAKRSHPSAHLYIADDVPIGQFEYYFCTTKCLRRFLNMCVDEVETKLKKK